MELNRTFLHPLGMALEVVIEEDGSEVLGGIWDYRYDPEGVLYKGLPEESVRERHESVQSHARKMYESRMSTHGFFIQPLEGCIK